MSGKPYPAGVTEAVKLMTRAEALVKEIQELQPKAKRLEQAELEYGVSQQELKKLLESMDLTSSGHYGYMERLSWFLQEMKRQKTWDGDE